MSTAYPPFPPCSAEGEDGLCFVETANLDGESNLKQRRTMAPMAHPAMLGPDGPLGVVTCEEPNNHIYDFTGFVAFNGTRVALGPEHLLLRGCVLRNTAEAVGLVVYAVLLG